MNEVYPLRLLIKTAVLFVVANLLFALFRPPVGKITLYNHLLPGRLRFPYEQEPAFYFTGFNAPVYENFDAMFGAHVVSQEKRNDEYRIFLLGDSSTWGISVQPGDMLSEQLNRLALDTCDGRNVRVYNLGYPMPFLMRDLLILDKAMEYRPDMVLWLVTLSTFVPKTAETYFIQPHAEQYLRLSQAHGLSADHYAEPIQVPSLFDRTIVRRRVGLKNIILNQAMGFLWNATGIDNHEGLGNDNYLPNPDVEDNPVYEGRKPGESSSVFNDLRMDIVTAGYAVAGDVPVILVNQPILVATGTNSDVRYNDTYPRWVYDDYRKFMSAWTSDRGYRYLDYWDILPLEDFSDQNFHRNPVGEEYFAERLAIDLEELVCELGN